VLPMLPILPKPRSTYSETAFSGAASALTGGSSRTPRVARTLFSISRASAGRS